MRCLILAGGLGTRMRRLTAQLPKSLIPVAGRPFVDWQLEWLAANGVRDVVLSVGYRAEMIRDHVADGAAWNVRVEYVSEDDRLLGTGGALRLAADHGVIEPASLVLYGDSYLPIDIRPIVEAFADRGCPALMTVWRNDGELERSNVQLDRGLVVRYDKLCQPSPSMRYIDYGLSVVTSAIVVDHVPPRQHHDLGDLLATLSARGYVAGYEVHQRFYEIGSEPGLRALEDYLCRI